MELYWITRLDEIKELLRFLSFFGWMPGVMLILLSMSPSDNFKPNPSSKRLFIAGIVMLFLWCLTPIAEVLVPTTKQMLEIRREVHDRKPSMVEDR